MSSKQEQTPRAEVKHNTSKAQASCGLCGRTTDSTKLRWREWAERVTGQSGRPPRAAATMGLTIDFRGASPVEAPVRCPICQGEQVQLTSVLCVLPNRQVAYMDHRGLQLYETDIPGGFAPGTLMVFRCSENHVLYRNLCPAEGKTLESTLGAHSGPAALGIFQPLWPSPVRDQGAAQEEKGAGR